MKLKKTYLSLICYLTLIAFIGVISVQSSSSAKMQLQKQEVSANCNLVFDEERDADDFLSQDLLSYLIYSALELNTGYIQNYISNYLIGSKDLTDKIPLYIYYRALRL